MFLIVNFDDISIKILTKNLNPMTIKCKPLEVYFNSTTIEERKNIKLQCRMMPKRY
jgi:hypothetical protein